MTKKTAIRPLIYINGFAGAEVINLGLQMLCLCEIRGVV